MCVQLKATLRLLMLVGLQCYILSVNGITTASQEYQQCGIVATDSRAKIFGGEKVALGTYPWIAIIGYTGLRNRRIKWNCGGSLIASRWVLTAAHCVDHRLLRNKKIAEVRLGEHTLGVSPDCHYPPHGKTCAPQPQVFDVLNVVQWPDFRPSRINAGNDIALIKLDGEVTITAWVSPVCLPSPDFKPNQDTIGIAAGWGLTESNIKSMVLLDVSLPYINHAKCSPKYDGGVSDSQLCFGGSPNKDTCYGDSGGPLVVLDNKQEKYILAGVVSYGLSCGQAGVPGIYTSVTYYLNWIQSVIEGRKKNKNNNRNKNKNKNKNKVDRDDEDTSVVTTTPISELENTEATSVITTTPISELENVEDTSVITTTPISELENVEDTSVITTTPISEEVENDEDTSVITTSPISELENVEDTSVITTTPISELENVEDTSVITTTPISELENVEDTSVITTTPISELENVEDTSVITTTPISVLTSSITNLAVEEESKIGIDSTINTQVLVQSTSLSISEETSKVEMDQQLELLIKPIISTIQQAETLISSIMTSSVLNLTPVTSNFIIY